MIRIPSVDPRHLEYVQQFITTMPCATLPSFDDALLDAKASAARVWTFRPLVRDGVRRGPIELIRAARQRDGQTIVVDKATKRVRHAESR